MEWLRRHALVVGATVLGLISFVVFSWAEYGYFCDQNQNLNEILRHVGGDPQPCQSFWSREHVHDWLYNAASNWQSELIYGIMVLVILMKIEGARGADKGDT